MRAKNWRTTAAAIAAAGAATLTSATDLRAEQPTGGTVFAVDWVGMSGWVVDEHDQGLLRAGGMLPARVAELPGEIPDMPPEAAEFINLALSTIAQPARFALYYDPNNTGGGAMGYGLVVSTLAKDQEHASTITGAISMAAGEADMPFPMVESQRYAGMTDVQMPFGVLTYGPRETDAGWRFEIIFGSMGDADAPFTTLPARVDGVDVIGRASMDLVHLTPLVSFGQMMAGNNEQVNEGIAAFTEMGLIGEDALRAEFYEGYTDDAMVSKMTIIGAKQHADALYMPTDSLTTGDFNAIPSDALTVVMSRGDLRQVVDMLDQAKAAEPGVGQTLSEFTELTGVDLQGDILSSIGGTFIVYNSESTGGGGMTSTVALIPLSDKERFLGAHEKLLGFANAAFGELPDIGRYIELTPWQNGDAGLISLRFKGLPVPLEITYSVTGDWLVAGATPQATLAAARQIQGQGDAGLSTNPSFADVVPQDRALTKLTFIDTPRLMLDGYGLTSLLGSGFGNLVRSPSSDRDPGLIVPVLNDLRKDARAMAQYSYWSGDDYVVAGIADRSQLVNTAGVVGAAAPYAPLLYALIGGAGAAAANQNAQQWGVLPYDAIAPEMVPGLALWLYEQPLARTALVLALEREVRNE